MIELIIIIVILGALSAIALSRFANLSEDAEITQAQGVAGSLRSGVNVVKSVFQSQGHSIRVQNLPGFGDGTVDTNNLGYPIGINKGSVNENIGRGNAGCVGVWNGVLIAPPTVAANNNNQSYRSFRHDSNRVCSYVYRDNGDNGNQNTGLIVIRYDSRNGSVVVCGQSPNLPNC